MDHGLSPVTIGWLVAILLVLSLGAVAGTTAGETSNTSIELADDDEIEVGTSAERDFRSANTSLETTDPTAASSVIQESMTVRLYPEEPGLIEVTAEFTIPENVVALDIEFVRLHSVIESEGLEPIATNTYHWSDDDGSYTASITYLYEANQVNLQRGGLNTVDQGEWALTRPPGTSMLWWYHGNEPSRDTTYSIDGTGIVGQSLIYLGPFDEYLTEDGEETLRLVIPEAVELTDSPEDIHATLEFTQQRLDIDGKNDVANVFAVPTNGINWAALGMAWATDAWVLETAGIEASSNVWIHEYVHLRQAYRGDVHPDTEWLIEGQADYYAALVNYELGHIDYDTFIGQMEVGQHSNFDDVVLREPATWTPNANYLKGALAIAAIDFEIRDATDGAATFDDVFRAMNAFDGPIDHATFLDIVEDVGGTSAADVAHTYAGTDATASTWDQGTFDSVFGQAAPLIEADFIHDSNERYHVSGPYGEAVLGENPEVFAGETIAVDITIENSGTATGTYDVSMLLDGEIVDERTGSLDPGESTVETLTVTIDEPGSYSLSVEDSETTVTAYEFVPMSVTDSTVSATEIDPGDSITLSATVTNENPITLVDSFDVTVDDDIDESIETTVFANSVETITHTIDFDDAGMYTISIGDHEHEIIVGSPEISVSDLHITPTLVGIDETITVTATVSNTGTLTGEEEIQFLVDDAVIATESVSLEPGESTNRSISHSFDGLGEYTVQVADHEQAVTVGEPDLTVSELDISDELLTVGESVTVTATVSNTGTLTGETDVSFYIDGEEIAIETVHLDPGESTDRSTSYTFDDAGIYTIEVGSQQASIEVDAADDDDVDDDQADDVEADDDDTDGVPGFTLVTTFVIVLGSLFVAQHRYRRSSS